MTFAYKGSTPEASLNMAAARAIVWLREVLDEKRERGEYSELTTVVRDLEDLAQLTKADLKKGTSKTQTTGGVAAGVLEDIGTEVSPVEQGVKDLTSQSPLHSTSPAQGWNEKKRASHLCSWTLTFKGESVTATAVGTKKKLAERAVAAELVRWLEKRDPIREILAWEERQKASR
jgi:hypothetical protein